MGRPKKDEFQDLDSDFQDNCAAMDEGQLRNLIAKVALDQATLIEHKENDEDLAQKKEAAKDAGAVYRDGTKMNKLRIKFARRVLGDKGKDTGNAGTDEG
jgi:uncharacterized membrane protein YdfJ with MMPL/SSD domain